MNRPFEFGGLLAEHGPGGRVGTRPSMLAFMDEHAIKEHEQGASHVVER